MSLSNSKSVTFAHYTQDQIKSLKDAFQLIDDNGDGTISNIDLDKIWQALGKKLTQDEITNMLSQQDNGELTFPAFLSVMSSSLGSMPDQSYIKDALQIFSKEGDLELSCDADELKEYLEMTGFIGENLFEKLLGNFISQSITGQRIFKGRRFLEAVGE
ncbi:Mlc2p Ecym_2819 [Eremothecium cymbalariae DBVPG|uniref:EF-hand domain-containing protein n=1 Tax=Eremothecium cymbalariae (strain CBS 270.75 / DBVPG 7215 / KCTC 17166 / NRRL Y-17582) TaxID=931890 RepID=G8JQF2_ERECY|nr:Hypothetical protein Ecym_2819 [Eremothecium cymbalariae DBVPG\